ncbi:MAG: hypothetical protein B7X41_00245, partial [Microbacterium sp. 14-71-5]
QVIDLALDGVGTSQFATASSRLYSQVPPANRLAIVLDGTVLTAPSMNGVISNGQLEISGLDGPTAGATPAALAAKLGFGHGNMAWTVTPTVS